MREFTILQHNRNSLIRWALILSSAVIMWIVSDYVSINMLTAVTPTAIVALAALIHHIYYEDYTEVGSFWFTEEGVIIQWAGEDSEELLELGDLRRVLLSYAGFYGQEHPTGSLGWQTATNHGDNNYIQFDTGDKRMRFCFYGNNSGDVAILDRWAVHYKLQNVEFVSTEFIRYPGWIRNWFEKPLQPIPVK